MFSIKLLQAISDWQRGGNATQKADRGEALNEAAKNLPIRFRSISTNCYRQIALDKSAVWNLGTKYELSETISSWTVSLEVSQEFKGGVPPIDYQGVIFKINPCDQLEVIINLHELFQCADFNRFLENNKEKIINFDKGTGLYGNTQKEVVISTKYLAIGTLFAFGGYSSDESKLAEMYFGHIASDEELEIFKNLMSQAGHECGAYWLTTTNAVNKISEKLKCHGKRLSTI